MSFARKPPIERHSMYVGQPPPTPQPALSEAGSVDRLTGLGKKEKPSKRFFPSLKRKKSFPFFFSSTDSKRNSGSQTEVRPNRDIAVETSPPRDIGIQTASTRSLVDCPSQTSHYSYSDARWPFDVRTYDRFFSGKKGENQAKSSEDLLSKKSDILTPPKHPTKSNQDPVSASDVKCLSESNISIEDVCESPTNSSSQSVFSELENEKCVNEAFKSKESIISKSCDSVDDTSSKILKYAAPDLPSKITVNIIEQPKGKQRPINTDEKNFNEASNSPQVSLRDEITSKDGSDLNSKISLNEQTSIESINLGDIQLTSNVHKSDSLKNFDRSTSTLKNDISDSPRIDRPPSALKVDRSDSPGRSPSRAKSVHFECDKTRHPVAPKETIDQTTSSPVPIPRNLGKDFDDLLINLGILKDDLENKETNCSHSSSTSQFPCENSNFQPAIDILRSEGLLPISETINESPKVDSQLYEYINSSIIEEIKEHNETTLEINKPPTESDDTSDISSGLVNASNIHADENKSQIKQNDFQNSTSITVFTSPKLNADGGQEIVYYDCITKQTQKKVPLPTSCASNEHIYNNISGLTSKNIILPTVPHFFGPCSPKYTNPQETQTNNLRKTPDADGRMLSQSHSRCSIGQQHFNSVNNTDLQNSSENLSETEAEIIRSLSEPILINDQCSTQDIIYTNLMTSSPEDLNTFQECMEYPKQKISTRPGKKYVATLTHYEPLGIERFSDSSCSSDYSGDSSDFKILDVPCQAEGNHQLLETKNSMPHTNNFGNLKSDDETLSSKLDNKAEMNDLPNCDSSHCLRPSQMRDSPFLAILNGRSRSNSRSPIPTIRSQLPIFNNKKSTSTHLDQSTTLNAQTVATDNGSNSPSPTFRNNHQSQPDFANCLKPSQLHESTFNAELSEITANKSFSIKGTNFSHTNQTSPSTTCPSKCSQQMEEQKTHVSGATITLQNKSKVQNVQPPLNQTQLNFQSPHLQQTICIPPPPPPPSQPLVQTPQNSQSPIRPQLLPQRQVQPPSPLAQSSIFPEAPLQLPSQQLVHPPPPLIQSSVFSQPPIQPHTHSSVDPIILPQPPGQPLIQPLIQSPALSQTLVNPFESHKSDLNSTPDDEIDYIVTEPDDLISENEPMAEIYCNPWTDSDSSDQSQINLVSAQNLLTEEINPPSAESQGAVIDDLARAEDYSNLSGVQNSKFKKVLDEQTECSDIRPEKKFDKVKHHTTEKERSCSPPHRTNSPVFGGRRHDSQKDVTPFKRTASTGSPILVSRKVTVEGDRLHDDRYFAVPLNEVLRETTHTTKFIPAPPKYEGIGPTEDGVPTALRQSVKKENMHDWYKTMYKSLHKADTTNDEYVIGYSSEPESTNKEEGQHRKASTLDSRYGKHTRTNGSLPKGYPPAAKSSIDIYNISPRLIEDFEPGGSSVTDGKGITGFKRFMRFMPSPNVPKNSYEFQNGYEQENRLVRNLQPAPPTCEQQRQWYCEVQRGSDPPQFGLGKPAPAKPIEPTLGPLPSPPLTYEGATIPQATRPLSLPADYANQNDISQQMNGSYYSQTRLNLDTNLSNSPFSSQLSSPTRSILRSSSRSPDLRIPARALFDFNAESEKEISLKKGNLVHILRQLDKNWYEGERIGRVGIFPISYVEIIPPEHYSTPITKTQMVEGSGKILYDFSAHSYTELSVRKGDCVALLRRIDDNWYEARLNNRKGIVPANHINVLSEPTHRVSIVRSGSPTRLEKDHLLKVATYHNSPSNQLIRNGTSFGGKKGTNLVEPVMYRAMYPYIPQNSDELELSEGDSVCVVEMCDDGWFVGTSSRTGTLGIFPGNYVERI